MNNKVREICKKLVLLGHEHGLENEYGLFLTHKVGEVDENSIMFIGRDTNGLGHGLQVYDDYHQDNLGWLTDKNEYYYTKSPFWRVIGKILSNIKDKAYNDDIFRSFYWSNLYRVSPHAKCKTPEDIKRLQVNLCRELIYEEICDLKPKAVVFLTGHYLDYYIQGWIDGRIDNLKCVDDYYMKSFNLKLENGSSIPAIGFNHPQSTKSKESTIIHYATNFLKNNIDVIEEYNIQKEMRVRHEALREVLNATGQYWWIYENNDLGNSEINIEGHVIGIESFFSKKNNNPMGYFNYTYTTWNKKASNFVEHHFYPYINNIFSNAEIRRHGKRIFITFNPLDISNLKLDTSKKLIIEKLLSIRENIKQFQEIHIR